MSHPTPRCCYTPPPSPQHCHLDRDTVTPTAALSLPLCHPLWSTVIPPLPMALSPPPQCCHPHRSTVTLIVALSPLPRHSLPHCSRHYHPHHGTVTPHHGAITPTAALSPKPWLSYLHFGAVTPTTVWRQLPTRHYHPHRGSVTPCNHCNP